MQMDDWRLQAMLSEAKRASKDHPFSCVETYEEEMEHRFRNEGEQDALADAMKGEVEE